MDVLNTHNHRIVFNLNGNASENYIKNGITLN